MLYEIHCYLSPPKSWHNNSFLGSVLSKMILDHRFWTVQILLNRSSNIWFEPVQNEQSISKKSPFNFFFLFHYVSIKFSDTLKRLKEYKEVKVPIYNFVTHRREERMVPMYGANVIIFEGIFAFHDKKVVDLLDMKVGFCLDKEMCSVFFIPYGHIGGVRGAILYYRALSILWIWSGKLYSM